MTLFKRFVSRLLLATEGSQPRSPSRYLPGPTADTWTRLHDALRREAYPSVIAMLEETGIVIFRRDEDLVIQTPDGPMPEACKRLVVEHQQALLAAVHKHARALDDSGRTRLHQAWRLNEGAARLLLLNGAHANVQDEMGRTALHEAVTHHRVDLVKALLDGGAEVAITDQSGRTPLHGAAEDGLDAMVALMVAEHHRAVNVPDALGRTALHLAAREGRAAVARILVAALADVDAVDREQKTPLALAVGRGDAATVEVLLQAGADPEARGVRPSPLAAALEQRRTAIAALLVQHGARVVDLEVPLLATSLDVGDMDLLEKTLGDKVPGSLENGRFLCEAVEKNLPVAVSLLLKAGAVADCQDNRPLKMAVYAGYHDIAAALKQAGASTVPPMQMYELSLKEKPFRFHLNLIDEFIQKSEYRTDDGWQVVEETE